MNFKQIAIAAAVATALGASTLSAAAQDNTPLVVSTGSPEGTYSKMFKSIMAQCRERVPLAEKNSSGADENIDNLINKQADLAFVQTDTLQFVAMNDARASEAKIRTLVPLHAEEVHVIALANTTKQVGGKSIIGFNVGGEKVALKSLQDMAGLKVGAWGGSYTTARAISYLGGVKYDIVRYDDGKSARAALDKGEIQAIIAVGGQPLGFMKDLNANYRLLEVDAALATKVKAYSPTRISYRNVNAAGVPTVAARAYLVTNNYATAARKAKISALKACIVENIDEFKEGTGHHPKWSDVDINADTVWTLYETVATGDQPAAAPAAPGKKK